MKIVFTLIFASFALIGYSQSQSTHYKSSIRGSTTSGNISATTNYQATTVGIWTEGHVVSSSSYKHATVSTQNNMQNTSVEQVVMNNVKLHIYPNPSDDYFNFSINLSNIKVEVRDAAGKLIHTQTTNDPISSFNWEQGMYIVTVTSGNTVATGKVVKM